MALKKRKVNGSLASRMGMVSNIDVYSRQEPRGFSFETNPVASMNTDKLLQEILKSNLEHNVSMRQTLDKVSLILEQLSLQQSKIANKPTYVPYAS